LRRLAELQRTVDENNEVLKASIERLKERTKRLNAQAERGVGFFSGALREYAEANRAELLGGGKKKSRGLPSGDIGWKAVPEKVTVLDEAVAIAWARSQPVESELLRIKEEVNKPALAAHFKETGEVPPGCDVSPAREEFVVKPAAIESTSNREH
jgi:phage host-nuclease inhibitor protein Gam